MTRLLLAAFSFVALSFAPAALAQGVVVTPTGPVVTGVPVAASPWGVAPGVYGAGMYGPSTYDPAFRGARGNGWGRRGGWGSVPPSTERTVREDEVPVEEAPAEGEGERVWVTGQWERTLTGTVWRPGHWETVPKAE